MGYSIRIRLKSVAHYKRCIASLKECGVQFCSEEEDELLLYRREGKRLGWLYIGSNRVGWVFTAFSVVANAKPMKRKEVQAYLRKEYDQCRRSSTVG